MKILSMTGELFYVNGRTDEETDAFHSFVKASKDFALCPHAAFTRMGFFYIRKNTVYFPMQN
jgi:hypothetical protein